MLYVIYCTDKPDHVHVRQATRQAHLDYVASYKAEIKLGGPMLSPDGEKMIGSLLVMDLPNLEAAYEWAQNDPYAKAGLFESVKIRPWKQVIGEFA